ncbi:hypothetical protein DEF24_26925, partial [Marinitenerispora sediminis]
MQPGVPERGLDVLQVGSLLVQDRRRGVAQVVDPRVLTWSNAALGGATVELTGYRYRRRPTLYWGDQGAEVRALQLELLDLGYSLGPAGADGDFGNATYNAVVAFQTSRGLSPADGIPGPETRAAMDYELGRRWPPLYVSHVAVSDGPWIDPGPE